jgi:hypothetical protein
VSPVGAGSVGVDDFDVVCGDCVFGISLLLEERQDPFTVFAGGLDVVEQNARREVLGHLLHAVAQKTSSDMSNRSRRGLAKRLRPAGFSDLTSGDDRKV